MPDSLSREPVIGHMGKPLFSNGPTAGEQLRNLPPPQQKIAVAVYGFTDQTGQFKPSDSVQTLSRAVTQGATSVLIKALQDAGDRSWFTVIERERFQNLLQERQIIREMRERYLGEHTVNPQALPPLLFAGILLEGGVIGYDTNTLTGGVGARFLGIGGSVEYRQDTVSVYLRAVSVKTGEVLASVVTYKSIFSVGVSGNAFKYIDVQKLLEAEAGVTTNEPDLIALSKAIEKAVYALVVEGADLNLWSFADKVAGRDLILRYNAEQGDEEAMRAVAQADAAKAQEKAQRAAALAAAEVESTPAPEAAPASGPAAPKPPAARTPRDSVARDSAPRDSVGSLIRRLAHRASASDDAPAAVPAAAASSAREPAGADSDASAAPDVRAPDARTQDNTVTQEAIRSAAAIGAGANVLNATQVAMTSSQGDSNGASPSGP